MIVKLVFEDMQEIVHVTYRNALQAVVLGAAIAQYFDSLSVGPGENPLTVIFEAPSPRETAKLVRFLHTQCGIRGYAARFVRESIYLPEVKA